MLNECQKIKCMQCPGSACLFSLCILWPLSEQQNPEFHMSNEKPWCLWSKVVGGQVGSADMNASRKKMIFCGCAFWPSDRMVLSIIIHDLIKLINTTITIRFKSGLRTELLLNFCKELFPLTRSVNKTLHHNLKTSCATLPPNLSFHFILLHLLKMPPI
jgi:hypothetical protein